MVTQISYFKSRLDPVSLGGGGELGGGNIKLGKRLKWRDKDEI